MFYGQFWPLVGAAFLTVVSLSTVVCWPILVFGLYRMLLLRFKGERVVLGMVFSGFRSPLPAPSRSRCRFSLDISHALRRLDSQESQSVRQRGANRAHQRQTRHR